MINISVDKLELNIDADKGAIVSLKVGEHFRACNTPIFVARLRDLDGGCHYIDSTKGRFLENKENALIYTGFGGDFDGILVKVTVKAEEVISWGVEASCVPKEYALEWIEISKACMPRLIDNCENGGRILFPYDEGILLTDETLLPRYEPEFPYSGAYFTFPAKVCSQFIAYLYDDIGLYIGAHDKQRAFKGIDFHPYGDGIIMEMRLYSGANYGENFKTDYPIIWQACEGNWQSAAEIYRAWFEENLPSGVVPTKENSSLPKWYENAPLVVTYPVRGVHDMDKMEPNALFPYTNALPHLNKIKSDTGCQIMALLMHWEGTAPWAPPYVWPPYGGEKVFNEFRDALHENGDLLGVYCSGFGYTTKSTLTDYNCEDKIEKDNVLNGVCKSPANKPELGKTCTPYQRYGYDICPISKRGKELLDDGFDPVFNSGVDYAQILDQNHGGGQCFCYARDHAHPPMPGEWMTIGMQKLLDEWKKKAPNMLFGCESASAEPFIGNLIMSDNRYELNYPFGTPVPVHAFIYHEYLRNFMGNQCGCPFDTKIDTLRYRLAYSFSIGDLMTLVLAPNGDLMTHWSTQDFSCPPDMKKAMRFIKNMNVFYNEKAKEYLYAGKMKNAPQIECESICVPLTRGRKTATLPRLLSSAWHARDGKTAYIVVNPENTQAVFSINGNKYTVAPLDALLIIE